ncbi:MAG: single-stranded-DNA-specific exonuclease RecJ, partial [Chloroflexi bacterium]|nr:single-stranded-DNA-specific exonuclease RecJ [Chloroflexota bacterium]
MQARLAEVVWRVRPGAPAQVQASLTGSGYPPLLAQLLYNRGISTPDQARSFLSHEPVSHDPLALPGMEAAVDRLKDALERKERIAVFGDFDVDGVTATALLTRALQPLGS